MPGIPLAYQQHHTGNEKLFRLKRQMGKQAWKEDLWGKRNCAWKLKLIYFFVWPLHWPGSIHRKWRWKELREPLSAPRQDQLSPSYSWPVLVQCVHNNLQWESFFCLLKPPVPMFNWPSSWVFLPSIKLIIPCCELFLVVSIADMQQSLLFSSLWLFFKIFEDVPMSCINLLSAKSPLHTPTAFWGHIF